MSRVDPLSESALRELAEQLRLPDPGSYLGFVPNSMRILAHRPEVLKAFGGLAHAVMGPGSSLTPQLRNLVAQMTSTASGCRYCQAHTAHSSKSAGVSETKERALWQYETSPLFSAAERAALNVARSAALVPNGVTDEDFAQLKTHFSTVEIVDIVAVISFFGFLNRFNDTMATTLEDPPQAAAKEYLEERGWSAGKHG